MEWQQRTGAESSSPIRSYAAGLPTGIHGQSNAVPPRPDTSTPLCPADGACTNHTLPTTTRRFFRIAAILLSNGKAIYILHCIAGTNLPLGHAAHGVVADHLLRSLRVLCGDPHAHWRGDMFIEEDEQASATEMSKLIDQHGA